MCIRSTPGHRASPTFIIRVRRCGRSAGVSQNNYTCPRIALPAAVSANPGPGLSYTTFLFEWLDDGERVMADISAAVSGLPPFGVKVRSLAFFRPVFDPIQSESLFISGYKYWICIV